MNFMPFLQVSSQQSGGTFVTILTMAAVFVVFYLFIIRPQNKKQKDTEKMVNALKKGDKVITIGGIHGEVTSTKEQTVIVKVDDECKLEFSRSAIATVIKDEKAEKAEKPAKGSKKGKADATETDATENK
ncbi:MAG TPA: preprotein translocase subunit YajC [Treponemataceae bacterium]|nr:preprotein translocase subunit YajC [Treponemataceae bacterium]HPS43221.1 preprotein translocase subunit YajC [Treponemataceae bacterium]